MAPRFMWATVAAVLALSRVGAVLKKAGSESYLQPGVAEDVATDPQCADDKGASGAAAENQPVEQAREHLAQYVERTKQEPGGSAMLQSLPPVVDQIKQVIGIWPSARFLDRPIADEENVPMLPEDLKTLFVVATDAVEQASVTEPVGSLLQAEDGSKAQSRPMLSTGPEPTYSTSFKKHESITWNDEDIYTKMHDLSGKLFGSIGGWVDPESGSKEKASGAPPGLFFIHDRTQVDKAPGHKAKRMEEVASGLNMMSLYWWYGTAEDPDYLAVHACRAVAGTNESASTLGLYEEVIKEQMGMGFRAAALGTKMALKADVVQGLGMMGQLLTNKKGTRSAVLQGARAFVDSVSELPLLKRQPEKVTHLFIGNGLGGSIASLLGVMMKARWFNQTLRPARVWDRVGVITTNAPGVGRMGFLMGVLKEAEHKKSELDRSWFGQAVNYTTKKVGQFVGTREKEDKAHPAVELFSNFARGFLHLRDQHDLLSTIDIPLTMYGARSCVYLHEPFSSRCENVLTLNMALDTFCRAYDFGSGGCKGEPFQDAACYRYWTKCHTGVHGTLRDHLGKNQAPDSAVWGQSQTWQQLRQLAGHASITKQGKPDLAVENEDMRAAMKAAEGSSVVKTLTDATMKALKDDKQRGLKAIAEAKEACKLAAGHGSAITTPAPKKAGIFSSVGSTFTGLFKGKSEAQKALDKCDEVEKAANQDVTSVYSAGERCFKKNALAAQIKHTASKALADKYHAQAYEGRWVCNDRIQR